jgi:hypothetical protein
LTPARSFRDDLGRSSSADSCPERAARLRHRATLAAEAAALEADEADRREMLEVAALMESMRAAG